MRRLPSMENGQAAFGDFAAAMSPHQTHQQFAHHPQPQPQPQPQLLHNHASQYNQHYYCQPPNAGTPNSHSSYHTSAAADPTTPTAIAAAAAASSYYQPPNPGTPNRHNGYPTSTTPTAAVLPNNGAPSYPLSNFDAHAGGNVLANNANANGFGNGYHGYHGHHGDAEAWLQSSAATLLVHRCMTAHKWDEPLARRILAEYTRFCHLKIRMGDANDQNMVAPSLVHRVWQSHFLDSIRYMEDIQSICGSGAYLHFNYYDNADHETKPRRIQSTETALMAMFGTGGIDRDIWTYYTDTSTTMAAAAAQTIASRAGGVGIGVGCGTNAGSTPTSGVSKHGTPSNITSRHGGAGTTPSSAFRRPPSVLRSSNRTNNTPLSTVSENVVSFKDQIKNEIKDDDVEEIAEEGGEEDDGDDDEESIKSKEDSDEENSLEPAKKRRKSKAPNPTPKNKTTPKASSVDKQETPTTSSEMKTPSRKASSSTKKKSSSKANDITSPGTIATNSKMKVVVTSWTGDRTKEILVAPATTAASLRDCYLQSMRLAEHLPETWKFTHNGLLLENETILSSLVPFGMEIHLRAIMDISPIRIDMFDGSIVEL